MGLIGGPLGLIGGPLTVFSAGAENQDSAAFIVAGILARSCIVASAILSRQGAGE